jgi:glycosyltransferase involved in cell wall biosynthesis
VTAAPSFSIVIPTYNRAEKLRTTLTAILAQTCDDFEVIVMDDGGEDQTDLMIKRFNDPRILYFKKENSGPLRTRAAGADRARGEWIAFCDSDDVWQKDYLQSLKKIAQTHDCDCVFSEYQVEGEEFPRIQLLEKLGFFNGLVQQKLDDFCILDADRFFIKLLEKQPIMISSYAIKRHFYEKIGGINWSMSVIGSEDSDLTLRASAQGRTVYNSSCSVTLGRGDDNISSDYIRNLEGGTAVLMHILENENFAHRFSTDLTSAIERQFLEIAEQYYWKRNLKASFRNLRKTRLSNGRLGRKLKLLIKIGIRSSNLAIKSRGYL